MCNNGRMNFKAYADQPGFKDAEFAAKVGCTRGYITQLRLGLRKRPSLNLALNIAKATKGKVPVEAWGIA